MLQVIRKGSVNKNTHRKRGGNLKWVPDDHRNIDKIEIR